MGGAPLAGWEVVVTRPAHQAEALARPLEERGARVVRAPLIALRPPPDPEALAGAARALLGEGAAPFEWVVLTSANAARALGEALEAARGAPLAPGDWEGLRGRGARVACVGPSTARALEALGGRADLVPSRFVAEGLLESLSAAGGLRGARVLLPRAVVARDVLPEGLGALGARVTVAHTYETAPCALAPDLLAALAAPPPGALGRLLTFTSDSTVESFVGQWARDPAGLAGALSASRAVVIGPVVAARARALGVAVAGVAAPHTVEGLVGACEKAATA